MQPASTPFASSRKSDTGFVPSRITEADEHHHVRQESGAIDNETDKPLGSNVDEPQTSNLVSSSTSLNHERLRHHLRRRRRHHGDNGTAADDENTRRGQLPHKLSNSSPMAKANGRSNERMLMVKLEHEIITSKSVFLKFVFRSRLV